VTLKERVFNDITMIQIKSQDAFGWVSSKAIHEMLWTWVELLGSLY
jgi:hypothetical protein